MLRHLLVVPVLVASVVACYSNVEPEPGAEAPAATGAKVTYWQDVRPVLEAKCATCHVEGGIAPFALTSYDKARAMGASIVAATASREMPPWPPGPLSPAMMHDRSLEDGQQELLARWVEGGSVEGDPGAAAAIPARTAPKLPSVDVTKDIGVDYLPPADVTDEYRCFLVDVGTTEDRVSAGFRVTPGNPKIVHHVITSLFDGASAAALRELDAETPDAPGWPCAGGPVPLRSETRIRPVGALGTWVPGVSDVVFPAGTGTAVPAGAVAVVQVHYNVHGTATPDRTKIEVSLAPKGSEPTKRLVQLAIRNRDISVPVGAKDVAVETRMTARELALGRFPRDGEATLHMVAGHMHMVGVHFSLSLERPSGEKKTLLDIPAWDFHWQGAYELATPIALGPDDAVTVRCVYDNTPAHLAEVGYPEAPRTITNGEGSGDEMCIGYLTVTE